MIRANDKSDIRARRSKNLSTLSSKSTVADTNSSINLNEDRTRNTKDRRDHLPSNSARRPHQATRLLQESNISKNDEGMFELRQIEKQEIVSTKNGYCKETRNIIRRKNSRRSCSQNESVKDSFDIQKISWSPNITSTRKCPESTPKSDMKQRLALSGKVSQQKCSCLHGFACLAGNHDGTGMKLTQNKDCDSGDNDANPNKEISTPRRRISSILLASLRQDYSDDSKSSALTGVARFVNVRSEELFFPDTSILFS
jgi:hypothetical protein